MNRERLESEISSLSEQVDSFATKAYNIADDSTSGSKIKTERVDWVQVEDLMEEYEIWYNQALTLVSTYLPKREADFAQAYNTLSSVIQFDDCEFTRLGVYNTALRRNLTTQQNLLNSIPPKIDAEELRVRKGISTEITNEEIHQAKQLLERDLIRPAGVVTGVALERHLLTECEVTGRDVEYEYDYGIKALADALYEADTISKTQHGQIEYLGKLRNKCAHADEDEPTLSEVDRLITQTEDIIRDL
ncbi:hypothetical protein PN419_17920 [Halorubrum ezzemoulense]|uniref:hypothetical protein n=1 Tax=Halorubrum TaxID=56688 RepID=UPI0012672147|nr:MULTISPECIES: hypothetical protein [Halorubrum]MDB9250852.1 hypothetical protein [Halorubrum ezzemoulense]MDB9261023.1 hypothetical protein [Halorubrum ezzemoulense]MDB9264415.1 hypothetical protein [Halorubrum ezzemoulense]MDB9267900.1 hypothetical protein [Halorubrum ezzemoulense]MDB9271384.1 hypothetical protein [Halorubrum ezzemoulense]